MGNYLSSNNISKDDLQVFKDEIRNEYQSKISTLQNINQQLEKQLKEKNELIAKLGASFDNKQEIEDLISQLSQEQINKYVEELLEDEETNIKYLPDFVERQIYRNVFRLSLKLVNRVLSTMSIEVVNHRLNMKMIPNTL